MGGLKSSMVVFMVMMVVSMQLQTSVAQTRHVVGDTLGWTIPPNGAADYITWANQQNFTVGDTLFFNFTTNFHTMAEVRQAAYGPCTIANPISTVNSGPATITVTSPGAHYYICTIGTHCQLGQKLAINVSAAAAAPTTPPPAATPTTPPPAATPTPTPTPTPAPVSPPTTSPAPAPGPSTTTPPPASTPAPSPAGASPPAPPPPPSSPSPSGDSTPPPSGDNTPPPPSPSNAAAFTAVFPATFLAVVFALFH